MMLHEVPIGATAPHEVNAVIEIPQGSSNKVEYDVEWGAFRLDRTLYSPLYYPCNYGFIPSTLFDDGDPLDILVLSSHPVATGTVLAARPVGVLRMRDDKGPDDKVIAVFARDPRFERIHRLGDLPDHLLKEVEHFFEVYKTLEDKAAVVEGWHSAQDAQDLILRHAVRP